MIDFDNLPKITFKDEDFSMIMYGLLPIVIGILALLVLMIFTEI